MEGFMSVFIKIFVSAAAWLICTIAANAFMEGMLGMDPTPVQNTMATLALLAPLLFLIWRQPS
jgi:hypothetical protein